MVVSTLKMLRETPMPGLQKRELRKRRSTDCWQVVCHLNEEEKSDPHFTGKGKGEKSKEGE